MKLISFFFFASNPSETALKQGESLARLYLILAQDLFPPNMTSSVEEPGRKANTFRSLSNRCFLNVSEL